MSDEQLRDELKAISTASAGQSRNQPAFIADAAMLLASMAGVKFTRAEVDEQIRAADAQAKQ